MCQLVNGRDGGRLAPRCEEREAEHDGCKGWSSCPRPSSSSSVAEPEVCSRSRRGSSAAGPTTPAGAGAGALTQLEPDEHAKKGMAEVLARCWAWRWGRGHLSNKPSRARVRTRLASWLGYCFTFLFLQTGAATPQVASLTFQQGASSVLLNLPANISAEDVRLDSEAWVT